MPTGASARAGADATVYPLAGLRATVLHAQRLTAPNGASSSPTPDAIVDLAEALGYIQIDTIQVVNRAHAVTVWARLGPAGADALEGLLYTDGSRRLYEGWGHAASIIPLTHYRFHRWRTDPKVSYNPTFQEWAARDANQELVEETLERIRAEGALRVGDFERQGPRRGAWYDWRPSKQALEALFAWGDLMVADRVAFQRVYDIAARVLPEWVDTDPVEPEAGRRFCLEHAARALGVFDPRHLTLYAYMRATPARPLIKDLIREGALVEVRGESTSGTRTWWVHRDNLPLLRRAAEGEIRTERTIFLAPFDSLFWAPDRDQRLWGFNQLLEAYKPAAERVYGYFCFPILHRDRLIGRFDPKLDRDTGVLHLQALYLEPGVPPTEELVADVAATMRDFLAWHGATALEIEKSDPPAFGEKLMKAL